jgi:hypothetical protein
MNYKTLNFNLFFILYLKVESPLFRNINQRRRQRINGLQGPTVLPSSEVWRPLIHSSPLSHAYKMVYLTPCFALSLVSLNSKRGYTCTPRRRVDR